MGLTVGTSVPFLNLDFPLMSGFSGLEPTSINEEHPAFIHATSAETDMTLYFRRRNREVFGESSPNGPNTSGFEVQVYCPCMQYY